MTEVVCVSMSVSMGEAVLGGDVDRSSDNYIYGCSLRKFSVCTCDCEAVGTCSQAV